MDDTARTMRGELSSIYRFLTLSLAEESISPESFVSVSIERGRISIAHGKRIFSRIKIRNIKTYNMDDGRYPQPGELSSFLRLFINETGLSGHVILVIPKSWVITRVVELPVSVKENLAGAISYELDRLTPFTSEDAFYDFRILNEDAERIRLFLGAVRTERVRPYIDVLKDNGFMVDKLTIDLSAVGTLCRYMGEDEAGFVVLRVDDRGYECGLFIDGLIHEACSNELRLSSQEWTEGFLADVVPLVEKAGAKGIPPRIILSGSVNLKKDIESAIGHSVRMIEEMKHDYKEGYTAVGGLVESLWKGARALNLLSRGYTEKQKPPYVLTLVLLAAFILSLIIYMVAPLRVEGRWLEEINRQIAQEREAVKRVEAMEAEIERLSEEISTISRFKGSTPLTLDILKELTTILPEGAWLTGLRLKGDSLEISGYATSATEILPILDASVYFDKVEFASPTVRDRILKADRFRIKMQIVKNKKAGGKNAEE